MNTRRAPMNVIGSNWFLIAITIVAAMFVVGAMDLKGEAAQFPTAVGVFTIALALIELIARLRTPPTAAPTEADNDLQSIVIVGVWFLATLGSFYVVGILPAIGLSAAAYFRIFIWGNLFKATVAGIGHAIVFWVVFDLLAGFRLYQGLIIQ